MGAALAMLPVDVGVGKMLVLGCLLHMLNPVVTIASVLSIQSPFLRVESDSDSKRGIQERRAELVSPHGDAITLLHVYEAWLSMRNNRCVLQSLALSVKLCSSSMCVLVLF